MAGAGGDHATVAGGRGDERPGRGGGYGAGYLDNYHQGGGSATANTGGGGGAGSNVQGNEGGGGSGGSGIVMIRDAR